MKLIIPIQDGRVAPRFGLSPSLYLVEIDNDKKIKKDEFIDAGSKNAIEKARYVRNEGIDILICLGIEFWLYNYLESFGIRVIPGITGEKADVVSRFIEGSLASVPSPGYGFPIIRRGRYRRGYGKHYRQRPI